MQGSPPPPDARLLPIDGYDGYYIGDNGMAYGTRPDGTLYELKRVQVGCRKRGSLYWAVNLCKNGSQKTHTLHRLVSHHFHGPCPKGMVVRHGPAGRDDNRPGNLSRGTYTDNMEDRKRDGSWGWKLSEAQARAILAEKGRGRTQQQVADSFNVSRVSVSAIWRGRMWPHLQKEAESCTQ